ncbi:uncharacterized protein F4807DRAFT_456875 [Annulohypoxylon truncatum]|uniref:uncharacterized protein n=1 Tax=Annulohypoxylon truncatum TaxID=327061 RepID=UPI0020089ECA|nr:uncharacterized protein F4807DRAFT_456875 [Annulohypoxylon truncatum]KAI1213529.1 hypothetical protein F4807DRAFT_456875 [Annulohypoxylon truncatum]
MSSISSNLVRAGLPRGIRITTVSTPYQHRSISWMPWEQPNPKLYIDQSDPVYNLPPPEDPAKKTDAGAEAKKSHADTTGTQDVRKAGEAAVAPGTAAVGAGGKQEVSTSGKTVPTSIQAGSLRIPSTQTRSMHTASGGTPSSAPALLYLPTTLLRIPGMPSTWPGESPQSPDQPRIRKRRMEVIHEFSSKPQQLIRAAAAITTTASGSPSEDNKSTRQVLETLGDMTSASPQTYNEDDNGDDGDLDPNTSLSFEKAVARYMEGVKAREEALAVADQSGDPAVSRQVLDEVERNQWRRVVWAALENLPKLPPESDESGKGKDTAGQGKDAKGKGKGRA